jgi:flavorubredoxin
MMTLEEVNGVLFTCDVFGSYRALSEGLFDEFMASQRGS